MPVCCSINSSSSDTVAALLTVGTIIYIIVVVMVVLKVKHLYSSSITINDGLWSTNVLYNTYL